ncbi:hypothetical protein HNW13_018365 [Shewanella sp. BF02_Schw]|uniref:hypothetical protein n=1 Tax=Shewanella sp. BF02_Schw TaxID=394908 RepID=UPI00177E85DF|nr:hypothetical protein [Shewanella sp. BF02_Schw]MBO1897706.1 hypothetical protein [Shewanella sp. BF02_Schw]
MNIDNKKINALRNDAIISNQIVLASILMTCKLNSFNDFVQELLSIALEDANAWVSMHVNDNEYESFAKTLDSVNDASDKNIAGMDFDAIIDSVNQYYRNSEEDDDYDYSFDCDDICGIERYLENINVSRDNLLRDIGITEEFTKFKQLQDLVNIYRNPSEIVSIARDVNGFTINFNHDAIKVNSLLSNGQHNDLTYGDLLIEDIYLNTELEYINEISIANNNEIVFDDYEHLDLTNVLSMPAIELFKSVCVPTEELREYCKQFGEYLAGNNRMILQSGAWMYNAMTEIIENDTALRIFTAQLNNENVENVFEMVATIYPLEISQKYLKSQIVSLGDLVLSDEFKVLLFYCDDINFLMVSPSVSQGVLDFAMASRLDATKVPLLLEQQALPIEVDEYACRL